MRYRWMDGIDQNEWIINSTWYIRTSYIWPLCIGHMWATSEKRVFLIIKYVEKSILNANVSRYYLYVTALRDVLVMHHHLWQRIFSFLYVWKSELHFFVLFINFVDKWIYCVVVLVSLYFIHTWKFNLSITYILKSHLVNFQIKIECVLNILHICTHTHAHNW